MLWLRSFVCDADSYTSSSSESARPANRDTPSRMNRHFSSTLAPGTRLVVAIAPEFTIGFVRPSSLCSIAVSELNGRPVPLTPTRSRSSSGAEDVADEGEDERLDHAHDRELVLRRRPTRPRRRSCSRRRSRTGRGHARQRRIHGGRLPFSVRAVALVRLGDEVGDELPARQRPSRRSGRAEHGDEEHGHETEETASGGRPSFRALTASAPAAADPVSARSCCASRLRSGGERDESSAGGSHVVKRASAAGRGR